MSRQQVSSAVKLAMGTPGIDVEQYLGWRMRREGITVAVRAKVSEFILSHKVVMGWPVGGTPTPLEPRELYATGFAILGMKTL